MIRAEAKRVQEVEQEKRKLVDIGNTYVVGDYILFDEVSKGFRPEKLRLRYSGPYVVTAIYKADISCKHIVTGKQKVFHMDNIKMFIGSATEAYEAAKTDDDQFSIKCVVDYKGDPERRTQMKFLVEFEDGDKLWINYKVDIATTVQFETFCNQHAELEPLRMSVKSWRQKRMQYNSQPVVGVEPGMTCYANLKAWGSEYYWSLRVTPGIVYVVECHYTKWTTDQRMKIDLTCPVFGREFDWHPVDVRLYGILFSLEVGMVLVDKETLRGLEE
jgi:hypothetical protein